ncbi:MAG: homoserine kinase [Anaerolineales bacterium]
MARFLVRVPASSANLGPGFDSVALALDLVNELEVEVTSAGLELTVEGEGQAALPRDASNLIVRAALRLFRELGAKPPGLRLRSTNRIPLGSGLGSSAAAIVAGLLTADAVVGAGLARDELLKLACDLEGHLDNPAASIYGGLVLVGEGPLVCQVPIGDLQVAVVVPDLDLPTLQMRQALPRNIPLVDAVFNLGRVTMLVEALRRADYELLSRAMEDRLHQPYRTPSIPGYEAARAAALEAGAAGVALSGAGPGLIAFASHGLAHIAEAMVQGFHSHGLSAQRFVLSPALEGARVLPANNLA